tara:strand:- start:1035 stop:1184 length:150 start_codon:yes stop_codon:yes gene_type:complete
MSHFNRLLKNMQKNMAMVHSIAAATVFVVVAGELALATNSQTVLIALSY